jgi:mono/diheme cytochrome c family protein
MIKLLPIALLAFVLSACQTSTASEVAPAASDAKLSAGSAEVGFNLAEALCSGCHSIALGEVSPNPQSPSFEMIANTSGLTLDTLGTWMHDSHNFPEKMNFEVADEDVDHLAAYIITLGSENYEPPIQ